LSIGIISPVVQLAPALDLTQDPNNNPALVTGGIQIVAATLPNGQFGQGREPAGIIGQVSGTGEVQRGAADPNVGGLRIGLGIGVGAPGGESQNPFIDLILPGDDLTAPGSIVISAGTLIANGYVMPTGAALLGAGDIIIGTAAPAMSIAEAATPTVTANSDTVFVDLTSLAGGDQYLVVISTLAPAGRPPVQVLNVQGNVFQVAAGFGKNTNGQPAAAQVVNGLGVNSQGNVAVDCWTIPAPYNAVTVHFSGKCASVIRAYSLTGVLSVGIAGYDQPAEFAGANGANSTAPTDGTVGPYFPGTTPYSLQTAVLSVIAYDSATATIGALNVNFTNDAAVHANGMTEQSGHAIVTRAGAGPGDYVGTLSHAQNWMALSVIFTGKAGGAVRLSPGASPNGDVLTLSGGIPSWGPVGAIAIPWPLPHGTDESFQPNGVANNALNLQNPGSAVNGVNITGSITGNGPVVSSVGSDINIALNLQSKGNGTIRLSAGGDRSLNVIGAGGTPNFLSVQASLTGSPVAILVDPASTDASAGLTIDAKGTGAVVVAGTSTGAITLGRATTITTGGLTISAGGLGVTGTSTLQASNVTSTAATAFTVAAAGANYGLQVDESTGSAVTGLLIKAGAAGGGLALSVINGNAAENLRINAKGAGTIGIGSVSTGAVTVGPATSITGGLNSTRITKRVSALSANSATPAINTDTTDVVHITAQTAAITSFTTNLTGTPVDGDTLRISITGTAAVGLTWGTSFEASTVALPTTTVTTARLDVGFFWNTETSKWRCVAVA
jgi:hypothetical protein